MNGREIMDGEKVSFWKVLSCCFKPFVSWDFDFTGNLVISRKMNMLYNRVVVVFIFVNWSQLFSFKHSNF